MFKFNRVHIFDKRFSLFGARVNVTLILHVLRFISKCVDIHVHGCNLCHDVILIFIRGADVVEVFLHLCFDTIELFRLSIFDNLNRLLFDIASTFIKLAYEIRLIYVREIHLIECIPDFLAFHIEFSFVRCITDIICRLHERV